MRIPTRIVIALLAMTAFVSYGHAEPRFRVLRDDLWGFIDATGEVVVEPQYAYAFRYRNGFTVVRTGDFETGKRAFLDLSGNLITDFVFDRAFHFVGGYGIGVIGGKWGFVAPDGSSLTGFRYDDLIPFSDGYAGVAIGESDVRWGIIDSNGREVLPIAYPRLKSIGDGYWAVGREWNEWALYRPGATRPESFPYRSLNPVHDGHVIASAVVESGVSHLVIDPSGKTVYESPTFVYGFSEGIALVGADGGRRFAKADGTDLANQLFFSASEFSNGVARVSVGTNWSEQRWGILSVTGQFLMPPRYGWLGDFDDNGIARFRIGDMFGFVDRTGHEISAPLWDQTGSFADGLAPVLKDGLWGYINTLGDLQIPLQFDYAWDFAHGRAVIRYGDHETGQRAYIDTSGRPIARTRFDWAYTFIDGLAHVAYGEFHSGTFGYISPQGEAVWEPSR